jgi:hypothetical protein
MGQSQSPPPWSFPWLFFVPFVFFVDNRSYAFRPVAPTRLAMLSSTFM